MAWKGVEAERVAALERRVAAAVGEATAPVMAAKAELATVEVGKPAGEATVPVMAAKAELGTVEVVMV